MKEIAEAINETRRGEGVEIMVQRKRCLVGGLYIRVIALSDMRRYTSEMLGGIGKAILGRCGGQSR